MSSEYSGRQLVQISSFDPKHNQATGAAEGIVTCSARDPMQRHDIRRVSLNTVQRVRQPL